MGTQQLPLDELLVSNGGFYDPSLVTELRFIDWKGLEGRALDLRQRHGLRAVARDNVQVGMLVIDNQYTFCHPGAELFVGGRSGTGAVDDSRRVVEFVYRNLGILSGLHCTLDTHRSYAIFHSSFLVNADGQHPGDFTLVSLADIRGGVWQPSPHMCSALGLSLPGAHKYLEHYCGALEKAGRYQLTIWPYHAMLGSEGHAVVSGLQEAAHVHAIARGAQTGYEVKGTHPLTENYSVLGPEVLLGPNGKPLPGVQRNAQFIEKLLKYGVLVIAGQAKSHCVAWTIADLLDDIVKKDPALARKVYLLEDCTSPVVVPGVIDYTNDADEAFAKFADAGMHLVRSTDPIDTWPGVNL